MLKKQSAIYSLIRHICKKMRVGRYARMVRGRLTLMVHSYYSIVFMFLQFCYSTRKRYSPLKKARFRRRFRNITTRVGVFR